MPLAPHVGSPHPAEFKLGLRLREQIENHSLIWCNDGGCMGANSSGGVKFAFFLDRNSIHPMLKDSYLVLQLFWKSNYFLP